MLRNISQLEGYKIQATDGEIGSVEDFYFDDDKWTIRYLVVNTGKWLLGREVLISPMSIDRVAWDEKDLHVKLSRNQVQNSPGIDAHKPIPRQYESLFSRYYGYPHYWEGPHLWGPVLLPVGMPIQEAPAEQFSEEAKARDWKESEDAHLRSTREVTGYSIEAIDGGIGHVEDFIVDDQDWTVRYMVADTRNWLPGKKVLVAPAWISEVHWGQSKVYVNLSRKVMKDSPEWKPGLPLSRDYEQQLYDSYQQPPYWS